MRELYEDPTKEQKETSLQKLLSRVSGLPKGKWRKSESPDFILESKGRVYGVEVTTLMKDNPTDNVPPAAIRRAQTKCLRYVAELLESRKIPPIDVRVSFRNDNRSINVNETADELVEFIADKLSRIDDSKTWRFYETGLTNVEWVSIHLGTTNGKRWLESHRVSRNHMNWVSVDPLDLIQRAIDSKERKLPRYLKNCDECWLVLGVDEWTSPEAISLTENGISYRFHTRFSRLFFVRNIEGSVYELSTGKPPDQRQVRSGT
jgi:hypothetical protein